LLQEAIGELQRLFAEMQDGACADVSAAPLMEKLRLDTQQQQDIQE